MKTMSFHQIKKAVLQTDFTPEFKQATITILKHVFDGENKNKVELCPHPPTHRLLMIGDYYTCGFVW